ncbi:MAG: DUF3566 domain-containing protein [Actinomycetota bacterium]
MSDPAGQTSLSMQARPDTGERVPEGDGGGGRPRFRRARSRQARVVIRKVAPWSVLKVSFLFYACIMVVILGALIILYGVLGAIGAIQNVEDLIRELFSDETFRISGEWLFTRGVAVGLLMVVLWSLINVFVALLYNLLSDIVGGIEVTLSERR